MQAPFYLILVVLNFLKLVQPFQYTADETLSAPVPERLLDIAMTRSCLAFSLEPNPIPPLTASLIVFPVAFTFSGIGLY